jgi:phage repressor protein C with HTH and peptisase S24 domain
MTPGERIRRAREARSWSQAHLARRVGISQPAIGKIEADETQLSKFMPRIAQVLEIPIAELDAGLSEPSTPAYLPDTIPEHRLLGDRDFPIFASAEGGEGQIIMSTDPVDFMPRPAPVLAVKGPYGLYVVGESMVPEYRPGDIAIVNPHLPVIGDEVYIFYAERDGQGRATIKHLRRASRDAWQVRQWNPPAGMKADFTLSRKEWTVCHRVIGKYSRR